MKPRSVKPLSLGEMEQLSTERLLAYLRKLHKCEESIEASDWSEKELVLSKAIVFKASEEWRRQYNLVKAVLSRRPHLG